MLEDFKKSLIQALYSGESALGIYKASMGRSENQSIAELSESLNKDKYNTTGSDEVKFYRDFTFLKDMTFFYDVQMLDFIKHKNLNHLISSIEVIYNFTDSDPGLVSRLEDSLFNYLSSLELIDTNVKNTLSYRYLRLLYVSIRRRRFCFGYSIGTFIAYQICKCTAVKENIQEEVYRILNSRKALKKDSKVLSAKNKVLVGEKKLKDTTKKVASKYIDNDEVSSKIEDLVDNPGTTTGKELYNTVKDRVFNKGTSTTDKPSEDRDRVVTTRTFDEDEPNDNVELSQEELDELNEYRKSMNREVPTSDTNDDTETTNSKVGNKTFGKLNNFR